MGATGTRWVRPGRRRANSLPSPSHASRQAVAVRVVGCACASGPRPPPPPRPRRRVRSGSCPGRQGRLIPGSCSHRSLNYCRLSANASCLRRVSVIGSQIFCSSPVAVERSGSRHSHPYRTHHHPYRRAAGTPTPVSVCTGARRDASSLPRAAVERHQARRPCKPLGHGCRPSGTWRLCRASTPPASRVRVRHPIQQPEDRTDDGCGGRRSVVISAEIWAHLLGS